jgi:tagatose-1,6-bisphosphate aldolase non-catalytic subunit AgaZ/GatZ
MGMMPNTTNERAAAIATLKNAVTLHLKLGEDDYVMVTELRCTEEGCPPLETVIAVLRKDQQKRTYKIHKPIAEIAATDLQRLFAKPLSSNSAQQELS